jgi:hypothetical protein
MYLKCSGNRPGDDSIVYYKVVESYRNKENLITISYIIASDLDDGLPALC